MLPEAIQHGIMGSLTSPCDDSCDLRRPSKQYAQRARFTRLQVSLSTAHDLAQKYKPLTLLPDR